MSRARACPELVRFGFRAQLGAALHDQIETHEILRRFTPPGSGNGDSMGTPSPISRSPNRSARRSLSRRAESQVRARDTGATRGSRFDRAAIAEPLDDLGKADLT